MTMICKDSCKVNLYYRAMGKVIDRIERLLDERGVPKRKQKRELANTCGISYEAVRQWWTITENISTEYLKAIAKHWNASLDWLITGEGQMNVLDLTKVSSGVILPWNIEGSTKDSALTAQSIIDDLRPYLKDLSTSDLLKLAGRLEEIAEKRGITLNKDKE